MLAFAKAALVLYLTGGTFGNPLTFPAKLGPLAVFEELVRIPDQWISQGPAGRDTHVKVHIGLKQGNVQGLQEKLEDISNPDSRNYGQWLSKEEIDAFVAPPAANVALVKTWLALAGIDDVSQPTSDWLVFTEPVTKVEALLDAKYEMFMHKDNQRLAPRTTKYSVPRLLHGMIDMITPTTAFYTNIGPSIEPQQEEAFVSLDRRAACNTSAITPSCINSIYDVDYTSKGSALVASSQFGQHGASHSDYSTFGTRFVPGGLTDFQDVSVAGGANPGQGANSIIFEGNLDTQYIGGISTPNPTQFLAIGPRGANFSDEMANFASYLTSTANPPSVVSTSYGGEEQGFTSDYLNRVCNEFMKAGARGISIFFASGDHGVGGHGEPSCAQGFFASWPSVCPWVTSVGGTQFDGTTEVVGEFVAINGSSGGGFSNNFVTPSYQTSEVSAYISFLGSEYSGLYNRSGRGYPDIALVSRFFQVIANNKRFLITGTSASSPSWAALVSVLNDYRNSQGQPNLGFINPLLYSQSGRTALRDITSGSNVGCDSQGFSATTGWDPATGLGTLDFAKLRAMI